MTSVDITRPEILEQLREKFKSQLGIKISDEEILEKCLQFSMDHVDRLISENERDLLDLGEAVDDNVKKQETKTIYDLMTGILEDEYEQIKQSGKTIKDVIRESWRF